MYQCLKPNHISTQNKKTQQSHSNQVIKNIAISHKNNEKQAIPRSRKRQKQQREKELRSTHLR